MHPEGRFQYLVVAWNAASNERISAGAVSNETLRDLINQLRAAGHTQFQVTETLRNVIVPVDSLAAE